MQESTENFKSFINLIFTQTHLKKSLTYLPSKIISLRPCLEKTFEHLKLNSSKSEIKEILISIEDFMNITDQTSHKIKYTKLTEDNCKKIHDYRSEIDNQINKLVNITASSEDFSSKEIHFLEPIINQYVKYRTFLSSFHQNNKEEIILISNNEHNGLFYWTDFQNHLLIDSPSFKEEEKKKPTTAKTPTNPFNLFLFNQEDDKESHHQEEVYSYYPSSLKNLYTLKPEAIYVNDDENDVKKLIFRNSILLSYSLNYELYLTNLQILLLSIKRIILKLKSIGEEEENGESRRGNTISIDEYQEDVNMFIDTIEQLKFNHSMLKLLFKNSNIYPELDFIYDESIIPFMDIYENLDMFIQSVMKFINYFGQIISTINLLIYMLSPNFIINNKKETISLDNLFSIIYKGESGPDGMIIVKFLSSIRFMLIHLNHLIFQTFPKYENDRFLDMLLNQDNLRISNIITNQNKELEVKDNVFHLQTVKDRLILKIETCHCKNFKIFNQYFKSLYYLIFGLLIRLKVLYKSYSSSSTLFQRIEYNKTVFGTESHLWDGVDIDSSFTKLFNLLSVAQSNLVISKRNLKSIKNFITPSIFSKPGPVEISNIFQNSKESLEDYSSSFELIALFDFYLAISNLKEELKILNSRVYRHNLSDNNEKSIQEIYGKPMTLASEYIFGTEEFRKRREKLKSSN